MKILVIGGTRFIGTYVVEQLINKGHEVALFHRGNHKPEIQGIQNIHGDRARLGDYLDQFRAFKPDAVIDMIPLSQDDAKQLIVTLSPLAGRVVAISSMDVYQAFGRVIGTEPGPVDSKIITETSPLRQNLFPYKEMGRPNYDKILVEKELMEAEEIDATVLRLPMVYGPKDYQHRMFRFLKRMKDKRPYIVLDEEFSSWKWTKGYVENVAAGIVLAVENDKAKNKIYNIGEEQTSTMKEWIEDIGKAAGWNGKVMSLRKDNLPEGLREKADTSQPLEVDSTRIRQDLGFAEIISYHSGLLKTIDWEIENMPAHEDGDFNYEEEDRVIKGISG